MNKVFNKIALAFTGLAMAIGVGVALNREYEPARAAEHTVSWTASSGALGTGIGSGTIATTESGTTTSFNWTYTRTLKSGSSYTGWLSNCIQLGKNGGVENLTLTTSNIPGTIKSVSIECASHGGNHNVAITVGGTSYLAKTGTSSWTTTSAKSGTGTSSGTISIDFTDGSRALYIKSLTVIYQLANYSVTYDKNDGGGSNYTVNNIESGKTHNLVSWSTVSETMSPPSGKQFKCWSVNSTERDPGYQITVTGNVTVSAVWEDIPTTPYVKLTLTSESTALKGTTVTVTAESDNLLGTGLTWSVTAGTVNNQTSDNTSFNGTLASTGTVTIKAQDNGGDAYDTVSVTVNPITVTLDESSLSIKQNRSATLTATVNGGSVIWTSNSEKVTVQADPQNALVGVITVAADAATSSTATITATSTLDNAVHPTCTVTVSENPFVEFTKLTSTNQLSTNAIYALTNEETYWTGSSISSSQIASVTAKANLGYFKLETATDGYYLRFVTQNSYGVWVPGSYINNSSGTGLSTGDSGSSVWVGGADGSNGIMLQNSSNSNRFLGWQKNTTTNAKAFSTSNLHAGDNNTPLYLYSVPYNKLETFAVSNQTRTFTAGDTFSLGNSAVLTAHYSIAGDTTNLDLTNGSVTYKINNVDVTTDTVLNHDDHNGKAVVITYTDASGAKASTASYTITVNYKPATTISLNESSANLSLGGTVSLTATITDDFADKNDVTWTSSVANVVSLSAESGTKTITVTGIGDGTTVVTATSGSVSASCTVKVDSTPILNLKDTGDNIINNQTFNKFTGDSAVTIKAETQNIITPTFSWTNGSNSVVTISTSDSGNVSTCTVTIVGAGSSDVTITVGQLSQKVTFSVTQSAVTSIVLNNGETEADIWDGVYDNTIELTPTITKQGNATNVINWLSDDTSVATVSSASTTGTAITVTAVSEGTAVITATSAFTPATYATFTVTVNHDTVTAFSWQNRPKFNSDASGFQTIWAGETTLNDLMKANGNYGIGTFAPTWASKNPSPTTPTMGTGAHDVHIVLSDSSAPKTESGLTPLTSSYVFQKDDNGKYVVAFYEGKASIQNTRLSITNWRHVIKTSNYSGSYDFSTATGSGSLSSLSAYYSDESTLDEGTYTLGAANNDTNQIKIGSNGGTGKIQIDYEDNVVITSVTVVAKAYGDASTVISVMGNEYSGLTTDNFSTLTYTLAHEDFDETNELLIIMNANKKRAYIQSISIEARVTEDVGKSSDCVALENFVDTCLHMDDYTEEQGWCNDSEHHYYSTAKTAYTALSPEAKAIFAGVGVSNNAFAAEYARLKAWAAANGDSFKADYSLAKASYFTTIFGDLTDSNNSSLIVIIISVISISALGGYFYLRKRKEK